MGLARVQAGLRASCARPEHTPPPQVWIYPLQDRRFEHERDECVQGPQGAVPALLGRTLLVKV